MIIQIESTELPPLFGAGNIWYTVGHGHVDRCILFSGASAQPPIFELSDSVTASQFEALFSGATFKVVDGLA